MSDASHASRSLRERLGESTEERLGRALSDLLENPLLSGAIGRAFDAREKAVQAQEVAMGALNIPSAADVERLTRRLRSVSLRLEGIEEGVERVDRALSSDGQRTEILQRLEAIEEQLTRLADAATSPASQPPPPARAGAAASKAPAPKKAPATKPRASKPAKAAPRRAPR
jgi:TolA-binding protein